VTAIDDPVVLARLHQPWTPDDDRALRRMDGYRTLEEQASVLARTHQAILQRRSRIGIARKAR